jgi:hypothetical protein
MGLDEYIQGRKQQDILSLFGTIAYEAGYDYKKERRRGASPRTCIETKK